MSKVTILLAPHLLSVMMFYDKKVLPTVREHIDLYEEAGSFECDKTGEDAAEEAFDLTNNPYRQDERVKLYGRGYPVSSGSIVQVDDDKFLCMSNGWAKL